jgi:hypothetical protein
VGKVIIVLPFSCGDPSIEAWLKPCAELKEPGHATAEMQGVGGIIRYIIRKTEERRKT